MKTVYKEHAKVFKAFSDEKRLQILDLLCGGEKCACVLLEGTSKNVKFPLAYHTPRKIKGILQKNV